jgi:flavodoxin
MTAGVRYFSRAGNTRAVAEAIAKGAGVEAISVDAPDAELSEPVDVLFVGGALYAYGLDAHLRDYLEHFDASKVGTAVLFSTSWISKHALDLMRKELEARGVTVSEKTLYLKSHPSDQQLADAERFAREQLA